MLLAQTDTTLYQLTTNDTAAAAGVGIFFLIFGVIYIGIWIWAILAILDVNKHSDAAWASTGQNKQTWLILNIVALFTCLLITAYYWFGIRPKLKAAGV